MKKLLAVFLIFLLFGAEMNGLGATPKTSIPNEFNFNRSTFLYDKLGFGDYDTMIRFMKEQIGYVTVEVLDQSGHDDFNQIPYKFLKDTETFEEFILRTGNAQLQHAINVANFPTNQELRMKFDFKGAVTNGINNQTVYLSQFYVDNVYFTPQLSGDTYTVPDETVNSLNLQMVSGVGGTQLIPWTQVKRASLIVLDQNGLVRYVGDSKKNSLNDTNLFIVDNLVLAISRRFVTNSCSGVLTVSAGAGNSRMYLLKDGSFVIYPKTVPPILNITVRSNQLSIGIKGGAPFQSISLLCYTNLNFPLYEKVFTLDAVGSVTWTTNSFPSIGIFSTIYH